MLPVSFVVNRDGVNARSAETGDGNATTHTNAATATSSRCDQRTTFGLAAAEEPGPVEPAVTRIGVEDASHPPATVASPRKDDSREEGPEAGPGALECPAGEGTRPHGLGASMAPRARR